VGIEDSGCPIKKLLKGDGVSEAIDELDEEGDEYTKKEKNLTKEENI